MAQSKADETQGGLYLGLHLSTGILQTGKQCWLLGKAGADLYGSLCLRGVLEAGDKAQKNLWLLMGIVGERWAAMGGAEFLL